MAITNDKIIFVSGCAHSGTTLCSAILNYHPLIYSIRRETSWMFNYHLTEDIIKKEYEFEKNKDEVKFLKKEILLEKTAKHVVSSTLINFYFPNNKKIYLVRNPLDTCASLYLQHNDIDQAINRWILSNESIIRASLETNSYVLRYENLINNTVGELNDLCNFLEVSRVDLRDFYTQDITYEGVDSIINKRNKQIKLPIQNFNGNYKNILNNIQIKKINNQTKKLRKIFNY